jgi:hypothetical protein
MHRLFKAIMRQAGLGYLAGLVPKTNCEQAPLRRNRGYAPRSTPEDNDKISGEI